ncbi:hypothetical protein K449DRAFT_428038 [Hypoxylon sp. EC38]|nr:hypothetical protein K449DRAFT_428038 [Hypoxylon sp. EC38]
MCIGYWKHTVCDACDTTIKTVVVVPSSSRCSVAKDEKSPEEMRRRYRENTVCKTCNKALKVPTITPPNSNGCTRATSNDHGRNGTAIDRLSYRSIYIRICQSCRRNQEERQMQENRVWIDNWCTPMESLSLGVEV